MTTALRSAGLRILALLLPASFAMGQQVNLRTPSGNAVLVPPQSAPNTYGTTSSVVYTIFAADFQLLGGDTTESTQDPVTAAWRCAAGICPFLGTAHLPNGAIITSVELEACDGSATNQLEFFLFRGVSPGQTLELLTVQSGTGAVATPGCALFTVSNNPHTVDNVAGAYAVDVFVPTDPDLALSAVRIRYNLQVSPAPGTATFNDVPTDHPQFQFVEALVAAGITAGCGSGNYCPDATLTRGQMAVFLAKALGLHFPN